MALLTQSFNGAQVFFVDPSTVNNSKTADISAIDLYFKFKPDINVNYSGIAEPGVTLFITETMYGVPRITRDSGIFTGNVAKVPLRNILTSSDATTPTRFRFPVPVTIETDKDYCFVLRFDGFDQFTLWKTVQGENLVGTTQISPGSSNKFTGAFFDFSSMFVADESTNLDEYLKNWRALSDTTLKFRVYVARYAHNLFPVTSNNSIDSGSIIRMNPLANTSYSNSIAAFDVSFGSYEFIAFDENTSYKTMFVGGQYAYQNTVRYPGGPSYITVATTSGNNIVVANSQYPNGASFSWSNIFSSVAGENYVVFTNGDKVNVRKVFALISNTRLQVMEPLTFTNASAAFMITPVGRVSSFNKEAPFGINESFLILANSSCNSTVRFVNNCIETISVTAGGTGYNNSDILYIKGFENVANVVEGGYIAVANLVTNSTGGITAVHMANLGCGFVNSSAIVPVFANSTSVGNTTSNTSAGSGATLSYNVGATIKTELIANNVFRKCKVVNIDIGEFIPYHTITVPPGSSYSLRLETNYYKTANSSTYNGEAYYVNPSAADQRIQVTMYDINHTDTLATTPVIPSKSNEFNLKYANGSINDKISNTSSTGSPSLRFVSNLVSNSDFAFVRMGRPSIQFSKYVVNNDATNEHTDSGNAWAKHITKTVTFTRRAEDVMVYLTAYKPANTDLKVYARIYNNEDPEAFDDKDWTELELVDGMNTYSSTSDMLDYRELTYTFRTIPEARTELTGYAQTALSATIVGSGTLWESELAVGDFIRLYQPLFPENQVIAAVNSIASNTSLVLDTAISNSSLVAESVLIEKITYPQQAFKNVQNDNIVRYYNTTMSKFDAYDTIAVKIVFLTDSPHKIPRVDDIRFMGVSA